MGESNMSNLMSIEDIEQESKNEHITANQLDILVSKTRELTTLREQEIQKLNRLHAELEERLRQANQ
jgi:hypothetical protein